MWICLNNAFVSAVQDRRRDNGLVVRAQRREHLEALFPGKKIEVSLKSDYIARVYVDKIEFVTLLINQVASIDYDNFKNSVKGDIDLSNLYADFWQLHREYQTTSPYRGLNRRK